MQTLCAFRIFYYSLTIRAQLSLSENPKHLPQTLGITLQAQEDHGDFLYSLIYNTGGVVLIRWLITGGGG
jgi:hypothetical protein